MIFKYQTNDGTHVFQCRLTCIQCQQDKPNGEQCRMRVCIGTPYCWIHLLHKHHLRIKESRIRNAGKGLFAMDPKATRNAVIFRPGDFIIQYDGEILTQNELDQRFPGNLTAPYGLSDYDDQGGLFFEDGSCRRGVGTMVNHASLRKANSVFETHNNRLVLIASKTIRNHQEILVNYGRAYQFNDPVTYMTK